MPSKPTARSRRAPSAPSPARLKQLICELGQRMWQRGLCAGNEGNISCRIGPNRVLCTPTNVSKGFMKPEDIATVDMAGIQVAGPRRRTSEILMHLAIMNARPDVNAVVHSHPPLATAFAFSNIDLPSGIHPETEWVLGKVPTTAYAPPGDHRLADAVLPFVQQSSVILLQSHGVVCFDADLEQAYLKLEVIETYAQLLLTCKQIGGIRSLSPDEFRELLQLKLKAGLRDPRLDQLPNAIDRDNEFIAGIRRAARAGKPNSRGRS